MAIAIVIPTLNLGGAERVSVNFANELASRGMDVDLIVFSNKGGDLLFDVSKKVRIFFFGHHFFWGFQNYYNDYLSFAHKVNNLIL